MIPSCPTDGLLADVEQWKSKSVAVDVQLCSPLGISRLAPLRLRSRGHRAALADGRENLGLCIGYGCFSHDGWWVMEILRCLYVCRCP